MKGIYRFAWDWRRMGEISGIFVATKEEVDALLGQKVYFGECLGKHSEVNDFISAGDIKLVSDAQEDVSMFERLQLETGKNPVTRHVEWVYENQ
jgi:hypothetical protein